jgi:hypothetical protein
MRLEESGQLKNPMTSSGIKPASFKLVILGVKLPGVKLTTYSD